MFMKYRKTILTLGLATFISIAGAALAAFAASTAGSQPKITMNEARAIALKAFPGTIMKAELEREGGGLRYSFDMRQGRQWREVGVDAMTGRILENTRERANPKD
jgi:uncharacterized membrane protein YkoI